MIDINESNHVVNNNMTCVGDTYEDSLRTTSFRNCDLNDLVGVSLVWKISDCRVSLSVFADSIHNIGD